MEIGLIDVDSKITNLALMKLSAWHKQQGDRVEFYFQFSHNKYDKIYASKIFTDTPDYQYCYNDIIKGGSGYDLTTNLPLEIENIYPDYSLYNCNYAMGFTTRGCIRNCPFCIVPKKEGKIKIVADIYYFWNGQDKIMLLDNNILALPEHFEKICKQLIKEKIKVDFNQGLDIRLIDDDKAKLLSKIKIWKQLRFAWDDIKIEKSVIKGISILKKYMPASRLMFYVLTGFNSNEDEDLYRIETLKSLCVDPFVMVYNAHKQTRRKIELARWANLYWTRNILFNKWLELRKIK